MTKIFKIVAISDTHNYHKACEKLIPLDKEYDMIIHAGDVSGVGAVHEVEDFLKWYDGLKNFKHKILIAGNHDYLFETSPQIIKDLMPDSISYLNDSGITIEGIKIWGSPVQPRFFNWAFNRDRGEDIKKHWDLIPLDTNILVTHGPAQYMHDYVKHDNEFVGCEDLAYKIEEVKPAVHICGHIHTGYGVAYKNGTMFYNASTVNQQYRAQNPAHIIVLEIDDDGNVEVALDYGIDDSKL